MDNNIYNTFRMPVIKNSNRWTPKHDIEALGIPRESYKRHYKVRWYSKGFLHFYFDKLLSFFNIADKPSSCIMWVEVVTKNCPNDIINKLLSYSDINEITTPDKYKF